MWTKLVNYLGGLLVAAFPGRTKLIDVDGKPYLMRFYIKHNGRLPGIYLHHFYQSDPDRDLHNHPWTWAVSLVLTGGYYEERIEAPVIWSMSELNHFEPQTFERKAPGINYIGEHVFRRVILKDLKQGAWTIFVSGREVRDWGFLTRYTQKFVPHMEYLGLEQPFINKSPSKLTAAMQKALSNSSMGNVSDIMTDLSKGSRK